MMHVVSGLAALLAASQAGSGGLADEPFLKQCASAPLKLWGRSLCAPIVIVDPATGKYRTSKTAPGPLPAMRANSSIDWGGEKWIMVLEPLPEDSAARTALLFHEAFHVHQKALGLPAGGDVAPHLDDHVARYLLRLEWNALAKALQSSGAERRKHIAQARSFRAQRTGSDAAIAEAERNQMRHEGLASYTGFALSGDPMRLALQEIARGPRRPTLNRSFAYVSGPPWALLLDQVRPKWRSKLASGKDLPDLMPIGPARLQDPQSYGGDAIWNEEYLAAAERKKRLEKALFATADERALRLPLAQMSLDFDPNLVSKAPDGSMLYRTITLRDRWGEIKVKDGDLRISADFTAAYVSWPLLQSSLTLAPGWKVLPGERGGARIARAE